MTRINPLSIALSGWIVSCAAFAMLPPSPAQADCAQWDISGYWELKQANGITIGMELEQTGTNIRGTAFYNNFEGKSVRGSLTGTINGNNIRLTGTSGVGEYTGGVGSDGFIGGSTRDADGNVSTWRSTRGATCQVAAGSPPPPDSKAFCQDYAKEAVAQAKKSQQMQCGYGGPRWDAGHEGHFNWCMGLDGAQGPPTTEALWRVRELKDCSARIEAAKTKGILQKPGSASDILKEVTPLPAAGKPTAKVLQDVDVYAKAGGVGKPFGVLRKGKTVTVLVSQPDQWCHVQGNAVPSGIGWVWCAPDFLEF